MIDKATCKPSRPTVHPTAHTEQKRRVDTRLPARGLWKAKKNKRLVKALREEVRRLEKRKHVLWQHVKAHTGQNTEVHAACGPVVTDKGAAEWQGAERGTRIVLRDR